jgi:hypothetical protein
MERFYKLWNNNYVFYARIARINKHTEEIRIGSKDFPQCVLIVVDKSVQTAELQDALYNSRCASNMPMPSQHGTLQMLEMSLKFVHKMYPEVERIELVDNSYISCTEEDIEELNYESQQRIQVCLADMYFIVYGGTWYQMRFGAQPLLSEYDVLKHHLQDKPADQYDFQLFWETCCETNHTQSEWLKKDIAYYQDLYNNANSWKNFFQTIYQAEECYPFIRLCNADSRILKFIYRHVSTLKGSVWYIPLSIVNTYPTEYSMEKVSKIPIRSWDGGQVRRIHKEDTNRMGFHKNDISEKTFDT